jgi:formate-dependent nitrite reductase membrane component NrfD
VIADILMDRGRANPLRYNRYLKPQTEWGWQVAVYLYLAGIGSGAFAVGLLMEWLGYSPHSFRPIVLWGPILVAIGALFLVLKLGVKRRFLNTILNPGTSWLSRGFYILSVCIIIGTVVLVFAILESLGIDISNLAPLLVALDIIGFVFALATAIYTGILIQSVKYVAFWNTSLLPALFTVSSLSTGATAVILSVLGYSAFSASVGYPDQLINALTVTELIFIILEIFVLTLYLSSRYKAEEHGKDSVRLLLSGNLRYVFWAGIVITGFALPIILEIINTLLHGQHITPIIAGSLLLIGGFFLRYGVVYAGIKDEHPLQRLMEEQYTIQVLRLAGG